MRTNVYSFKQTHKGPKIVARFQGLDPPDTGSGKLIDVGILSGRLGESSKQGKRIFTKFLTRFSD